MSVADGSYDGIFSSRFCGKQKSKSGNGFKIPSEEIQKELVAKCVDQGNNLFLVPSKSIDGEMYLVDMSLGRCECKVMLIATFCHFSFKCQQLKPPFFEKSLKMSVFNVIM